MFSGKSYMTYEECLVILKGLLLSKENWGIHIENLISSHSVLPLLLIIIITIIVIVIIIFTWQGFSKKQLFLIITSPCHRICFYICILCRYYTVHAIGLDRRTSVVIVKLTCHSHLISPCALVLIWRVMNGMLINHAAFRVWWPIVLLWACISTRLSPARPGLAVTATLLVYAI